MQTVTRRAILTEGRQGAKRQQTQEFNIRRFFADLKKEDPLITEDQAIFIYKQYANRLIDRGDRSVSNAALDHSGANNFRALEREEELATRPPKGSSKIDPAQVSNLVDQVEAKILLRTILPSGKLLCDSTREEIIEHHGHLTVLIDKLQPGQTPRQAGLLKGNPQ